METFTSSFSGLTYIGDENVQYRVGKYTVSLWCKDRNGEWQYVGHYHSLVSFPDGLVHFNGANYNYIGKHEVWDA